MTLPASGSISLSQVNTELGYSSSATISLNDSAVRTLFGVSSGAISMSNGYGKANQFAFTISSNQTNANLATLATSAGWNGTSKVVATIGSGVYISSNSTGTPALTISGSFPGGVELVNNGYIIGMGGAGGGGGAAYQAIHSTAGTKYANPGAAGSSGGLALSVSTGISITNNNTIAGGGGGGGGGGGAYSLASLGKDVTFYTSGGSGGGGGRSSASANSASGAGGTGSGFSASNHYRVNGAAGGVGTYASQGSGGASQGTTVSGYYAYGGAGGSGGSWGTSGSTGNSGIYRATGTIRAAGAGAGGGSGGGAVSGNGYITWVATGTRLGSIS